MTHLLQEEPLGDPLQLFVIIQPYSGAPMACGVLWNCEHSELSLPDDLRKFWVPHELVSNAWPVVCGGEQRCRQEMQAASIA